MLKTLNLLVLLGELVLVTDEGIVELLNNLVIKAYFEYELGER